MEWRENLRNSPQTNAAVVMVIVVVVVAMVIFVVVVVVAVVTVVVTALLIDRLPETIFQSLRVLSLSWER